MWKSLLEYWQYHMQIISVLLPCADVFPLIIHPLTLQLSRKQTKPNKIKSLKYAFWKTHSFHDPVILVSIVWR